VQLAGKGSQGHKGLQAINDHLIIKFNFYFFCSRFFERCGIMTIGNVLMLKMLNMLNDVLCTSALRIFVFTSFIQKHLCNAVSLVSFEKENLQMNLHNFYVSKAKHKRYQVTSRLEMLYTPFIILRDCVKHFLFISFFYDWITNDDNS
tara:strand:- start:396 stop:839 length:444 start_codon:yes stop_codon:yes gene_type:complete